MPYFLVRFHPRSDIVMRSPAVTAIAVLCFRLPFRIMFGMAIPVIDALLQPAGLIARRKALAVFGHKIPMNSTATGL
jgi:hypothetical protein